MDNECTMAMIDTLDLFPEINKALIDLLASLEADDWDRKTVIPGRTVKDLAAHILDGSLRRLSMCRDNYFSDSPNIASYEDLVSYIQQKYHGEIPSYSLEEGTEFATLFWVDLEDKKKHFEYDSAFQICSMVENFVLENKLEEKR